VDLFFLVSEEALEKLLLPEEVPYSEDAEKCAVAVLNDKVP
jgi:hypothetical protein